MLLSMLRCFAPPRPRPFQPLPPPPLVGAPLAVALDHHVAVVGAGAEAYEAECDALPVAQIHGEAAGGAVQAGRQVYGW